MSAFRLLAAVAIVLVAGAALFVWTGTYNIAADDPHWTLTDRLLETARERSIAARAGGVEVPDLNGEERIRGGAGNYDAMCAGCHLHPGVDESGLSSGLNPAPPNLARDAIDDPAEAFWTIKHGIKMTGMPAWGGHMEDEYIWGLVAFLRRLPSLSPEEYRALVEASGGHSHDPLEGPAAEAEKIPEGEAHVHKDGRRHQH